MLILWNTSIERPLEQAPYAFYAVCVNISHNPFFLGMSHSLMARIMVGYADIRPQFIRVYSLGFVFHGTLDEVMESAAFDVRDTLDANLTFALDGSDYPSFVALVCVVLSLHFTAHERFIDFHDSEKRRAFKRFVSHRLPDPVAKIPSRFAGNSESSLHLIRGDSLFRFTHEVYSEKPLAEREVGVVHDRSSRNAELAAA